MKVWPLFLLRFQIRLCRFRAFSLSRFPDGSSARMTLGEVHERPGHRHPLLFAARKFGRFLVRSFFQPDLPQKVQSRAPGPPQASSPG